MQSKKIIVSGKVQGVGFRPFIYRIAHENNISGWVKNQTGQVVILAQGNRTDVSIFEHAIIEQYPPLAEPNIVFSNEIKTELFSHFSIEKSESQDKADIHIPADYFTCDDCLDELLNPKDHRYRYPFINCTNCGPRYTIIEKLPYDRPDTSMKDFKLCDDCHAEYTDPINRRFHAQPVACETCGPVLSYSSKHISANGNEVSLKNAIDALKEGKILAVKGIGGYHLMCDASNEQAVANLRERKHRPDKPFAVLFPWAGEDGLNSVREHLKSSDEELKHLSHPSRNIVLVKRKLSSTLAKSISPGLNEIGAMLPYSPLHHLLSKDFANPLIATSANFTGEPVITDNQQAEQRLNHIVDGYLHHNRPIVRPADDSVIRFINKKPQAIRLGRGIAPLELTLPFKIKHPVLAVGGHMKNNIALAWDSRIVISPHIGDLSSVRSMEVFQQVINDLQQLYQLEIDKVICDQHPDYASTRWAEEFCKSQNKKLLRVYHHHAHAAVLAGEYPEEKRWLAFCWDGTGFGDDKSIWGGETFLGNSGEWQRVASTRPLSILGGDKASLQPWRSAAAMAWGEEISWSAENIDTDFAYQAWHKHHGCFSSSAVGRLFDAAAAFILNIYQCSFDGQAPMQLEQVSNNLTEALAVDFPLKQLEDLLQVDWSPVVNKIMDSSIEREKRSTIFHSSIAMSLVKQAEHMRDTHGEFSVGLSGGVFQNKLLTEFIITQLHNRHFKVFTTNQIPCNDAGISYGQIIEAHKNLI